MYDPNEIIINGDVAEIVLCGVYGEEVARTLIDVDDIEKCTPYHWALCGRYVTGTYRGEKTPIGRFILNITDKKIYCDHIDRNPLNNRKSNLRPSNPSQNAMNVGVTRRNKSGYKGVYYGQGCWNVSICVDRKIIHSCGYKTSEEAALKYNELAKQYHGEFAYINQT